jgi:uncharacterized membrane protein (UPF0127 family)
LRSKSAESTLTFEAAADNQITRVAIGGKVFNVEIAQTEEQKAQGLSGREKLDKNSGMIFVFTPPTIPTFWMRDMRFALDFVWINEDLEVVDITRNVPPPEPNTPLADLPLFSPRSEVKYVLEINAGETSGISIGDRVQIFDTSSL